MDDANHILLMQAHMPVWRESPTPPQFGGMVDKSWYYVTPDQYYIALVFTSKLPGSNGRAMAVYRVKGEKKARNEKFENAQLAMDHVQREASQKQLEVQEWK